MRSRSAHFWPAAAIYCAFIVAAASLRAQVATPALAVVGVNNSAQTMMVSITETTTGATLYYTTNGTTPTTSSSTLTSSGTLTLSVGTTLEVNAVSGAITSNLVTAQYTNFGLISSSGDHTLVLNKNGTISAWGNGSSGQLGHGSTASSNLPIQTQISSGTAFTGAYPARGLVTTTQTALQLPVASGLTAWYKADAGVTLSGTNVTGWTDQMGHYSLAGTGTSEPTLVTNDLGNKPAIRFNGNQWLYNSGNISDNGAMTIIMLEAPGTTNSNYQSILFLGNQQYPTCRSFEYSGNQEFFDASFDSVSGGTEPAPNQFTAEACTLASDLATVTFYQNGTQTVPSGILSPSVQPMTAGVTVGAVNNGNSAGFQGDVAEVLIYGRQLSPTELQEVQLYFANKYGLYAAGASWISLYSPTVQVEINRNSWSRSQADAYVAFQNANPGTLTTGLVSWFRADSGVQSTGTTVNEWNDQTGNYSVIAPSGNQPSLVTNDINGKPAIRFNGSQWLYNGSNVSQNKDMTLIAMVAPATSTTNYQSMLFLGNQDYPTCRSLVYSGGQQTFDASYDGISVGSEPLPNQFTMQAATLGSDLATVTFYQNGVQSGTGTLSPALANMTPGVTIGGITNGNVLSQCFQGDIAEVLVYDHQLSPSELQQATFYLSDKYGFYYAGAPWIGTYSAAVQSEINRNQWNASQANAYVALQNNNPTMLTTGLLAWLNAGSGITEGIGPYVSQWVDQAQGTVLTQTSLYNQPKLVANACNGQPALLFTGSQRVTSTGTGVGPGIDADMTIVTVGNSTAYPSQEDAVYLGNDTNPSGYTRGIGFHNSSQYYENASQYFDQNGGGSVGASAPATGVFSIQAISLNSSLNTVSFYQNGSLTTSASVSGLHNPGPGISIGGNYSNQTNFWNGYISEVLVYDHQLSSNEMQEVSLYLANKYGLYYPGASWIATYSSAVQTQINANQWNESQANQYVQITNILPVPSGLISWYKAGSGVTSNSLGQVTSWLDSGMAGNNVSQTTASSCPTVATDPTTGTPTVNFTTAQSLTQNAGFPTPTASSVGDSTIIAVASTSAPSSMSSSPLVQYGTSVNDLALSSLLYNYANSSLHEMFYDGYSYYTPGGTIPTTTNLTTTAVTYSHSSSALSFYLNGAANGTATAGATPGQFSENVTLGGTLGGNAWQGNVSEVLIYNRVLSATEIQEIQTYINAKYPSAAAPSISPNGGSFSGTQTVTLSGATSPAVILYTTNGTLPTSSSPQYSSPFTVGTDGEIVKAAIFSGSTQISQVATATFWIGDTSEIGIPDSWQETYFNNHLLSYYGYGPNTLTAIGSGLTYLQAYQLGYDPTKYSTNLDGLSDLLNYELGYLPSNPNFYDINGYKDQNGNAMSNAAQLALGLDPFDTGVNPSQPTLPTPNSQDHAAPPINLTQPANLNPLP